MSKVEGKIDSLFVEPSWLRFVHQGYQDAADPDIARILGKARGNSAYCELKFLHGLELVYR